MSDRLSVLNHRFNFTCETCCILTVWEDWQNPVLWERQVGSVNDFKGVCSDLFCLALPKTVSSSLKLTTRKCSNSKKPKKKPDCSFFFLIWRRIKENVYANIEAAVSFSYTWTEWNTISPYLQFCFCFCFFVKLFRLDKLVNGWK